MLFLPNISLTLLHQEFVKMNPTLIKYNLHIILGKIIIQNIILLIVPI